MRKIIIANWGKLTDPNTIQNFLTEFIPIHPDIEVIIAPQFRMKFSDGIKMASQDCPQDEKFCLGHIPTHLMKKSGIKYCLVGSSHQRKKLNQGDGTANYKIRHLQKNKMIPIYSCGEDLSHRTLGNHFTKISDQMLTALDGSNKNIIVVYEPMWAAGGPRICDPQKIECMISHIRDILYSIYGKNDIPVLYSGSISPNNSCAVSAVSGLNGLMVGRSSRDPYSMMEIIDHFEIGHSKRNGTAFKQKPMVGRIQDRLDKLSRRSAELRKDLDKIIQFD